MYGVDKTAFWNWLRNCSIRKRLNYSIAFLVIFPVVMIMFLTHVIIGNTMKTNLKSYSEQFTDQLGESVEDEIKRLIECVMEMAYSENFQNMVQHQGKSDWDFLNNYRLVCNMSRTRFDSLNYVRQVEYKIIGREMYHLYGTEDTEIKEQMEQIIDENQGQNAPYFWYYPETIEEGLQGLYMVARVTKLTVGTASGMMLIGIDTGALSDFYSGRETAMGEGTEIFMVNQQGALISGDAGSYESLNEEHLFETLSSDNKSSEDFQMNGGRYMGIWNRMDTTGWYILAMIPYTHIDSVSNSTSVMIFLIGVIVLALGLTMAAVINRSIVVPLNRILDYTNLLRGGDFSGKIEDDGEDEIRQLADSFNCATAEINRLMCSIKEQSEQKARLEFDALQAQINPHFLANTLNTISYLAQLRGMQNIENISHALTNILMVSMGKESKIITLEKEISYVKDYLLIQSYRYTNLYEVEFDIQEELLSYKIPKFILQPIVENAIVHGVSKLYGQQGLVKIGGYLYEDAIYLFVIDNGPGISEELQAQLLAGEKQNEGICGLGVRSVNQRLKLLFGPDYGVFISSRAGYTKVELVLPTERSQINEINFGGR